MAETEENLAKIQVRVLHQDMIVTMIVPGDCQNIEATDIFRVLESHKIVFGIEHKEIEKHIQDKHFDKEFVAAVGKHPIIGQDARIIFYFDTNPKKPEPKKREDGSVDQHELAVFPHVDAQTLIAKKIPATVSKGHGFTVYGRELPSSDGKDCVLKAGANVKRSESGLEYYAAVGGAPKLINDTVMVETLYVIEGDVDISTGNIHYQGDVRIKGNVSSHFNLEATGNIIIEGSIEAAQIVAGGSITGLHGIIGGNQGSLKAGADIHIAFAESAHLEAKGSVYVNRLIRQCNVIAGHSIFCDREDGLIA
ncbi:MAG: FapA family protein, partial [Candidatus Margulisiibacteriota bacterium]